MEALLIDCGPVSSVDIGGHIGSRLKRDFATRVIFVCGLAECERIQTKIKIEIYNENVVENDIFIYNYGKSTYHYGAGYHCDRWSIKLLKQVVGSFP